MKKESPANVLPKGMEKAKDGSYFKGDRNVAPPVRPPWQCRRADTAVFVVRARRIKEALPIAFLRSLAAWPTDTA